MSANGVNNRLGSTQSAKAGVSMGDAVWLHACRNSPVRHTPMYQMTHDKVQTFLRGRQNGVVTAG